MTGRFEPTASAECVDLTLQLRTMLSRYILTVFGQNLQQHLGVSTVHRCVQTTPGGCQVSSVVV